MDYVRRQRDWFKAARGKMAAASGERARPSARQRL
jgi:hypothetical protein